MIRAQMNKQFETNKWRQTKQCVKSVYNLIPKEIDDVKHLQNKYKEHKIGTAPRFELTKLERDLKDIKKYQAELA